MNIIGINDGHNASVSLSMDGEIKFAISEERITRKKNYWGMPEKSLSYIYKNIIDKDKIDYFGIYRNTTGDFVSYLWGNHKANEPGLTNRIIKPFIRRYGSKNLEFISKIYPQSYMKSFYANYFDVNPENIILVNHHRAHAESAFFNLDKNMDWLVFTCDAEGDLESGTVYKLRKNHKASKLSSIHRKDSLGYFYMWITKHLGMKPNQHEFKVMGLEPYVRKNTSEYIRVYDKISKLFYFDGLDYRAKIPMTSKKYIKWLKKELHEERFDNIAAATQKTFEVTTIKWVQNWIKETGISNVALSGGSFMNVKASQHIASLSEVDKCYVVPSSGDETTVFGVCNNISTNKDNKSLESIDKLFLGINFENKVKSFVKTIDKSKYNIQYFENDIEKEVAKLLADGKIVSRYDGRDEFGARALGNRSILAHPSNPETINEINKLIKDRDFWMPFTPSVLEEDSSKYIVNPKNIYSPYMSLTFDVTNEGYKHFSAAIHPYDKTMRIQMVRKNWSPSYHKLISYFKEITGISGLLNTSFNLHGEPNVHRPEDALHTIENSGLNFLAIHNYLISKAK